MDKKTKNYVVYAYYDEETNAAYIGLTKNMKNRIRAHKASYSNSTVYEYFSSIHKEIPIPVLLHTDLTAEEAQYYEGYEVDQHRTNGWKILNKAKTGKVSSSLGNTKGKEVYWNEERALEEARKYSSRETFKKCCSGAYNYLIQHNKIHLLDGIFLLKHRQLSIYSASIEAMKYKNKHDLKKNDEGVYVYLLKNDNYGLLDLILGDSYIKWTEETALAEARKYSSRAEFIKGCESAYKFLLHNKLISRLDDILPKKELNTIDSVLNVARKCKDRKEFYTKYSGAYCFLKKNKELSRLNEIFPKKIPA